MEESRLPSEHDEPRKPGPEISKETDPLADENLQEDTQERQGDNLW
jgi:hypothetical protein